jgi:hypothetical protein
MIQGIALTWIPKPSTVVGASPLLAQTRGFFYQNHVAPLPQPTVGGIRVFMNDDTDVEDIDTDPDAVIIDARQRTPAISIAPNVSPPAEAVASIPVQPPPSSPPMVPVASIPPPEAPIPMQPETVVVTTIIGDLDLTPDLAKHYTAFIADYGDYPDQEVLQSLVKEFYG